MSDWWHGFFVGSFIFALIAAGVAAYGNYVLRQAMTAFDVMSTMYTATFDQLHKVLTERDAWKAEAERLRAFQKKTTGVTLT